MRIFKNLRFDAYRVRIEVGSLVISIPARWWPVLHPSSWSRHALPAAASLATCRLRRQGKPQAAQKLYRRLLWSQARRRASAGSCQCCCLLPARPGFLNLTGATPFLLLPIGFSAKLCCRFRVPPPRDYSKMSGEKDELVQKAKLAEQAER